MRRCDERESFIGLVRAWKKYPNPALCLLVVRRLAFPCDDPNRNDSVLGAVAKTQTFMFDVIISCARHETSLGTDSMRQGVSMHDCD